MSNTKRCFMCGCFIGKNKHICKPSIWKGRKRSKEQVQKHSAFLKEYYKTHAHPMKDKKHSEESKAKMSKTRKGTQIGAQNHNWQGGHRISKNGYIYFYTPDHPFCDKQRAVFEHRLVMENHLGRYIDPKEVVHHINGIKDDNRLENLVLFKNSSEHRKHHHYLNCCKK